MSRANDLTNLYHNSPNSSSHVSSLAMSRRVSDLLIGKSKVRLNSREQGIFPSLSESLAKTDICSVAYRTRIRCFLSYTSELWQW